MRILTLLLGASLLAMAWAQDYPTLDWSALTRGGAQPGLVRVTGRYLPYADFQDLIRGVLTNGDYALRVEGSVFDWRPEAGAPVQLWGVLERGEAGYVLRVHNGRDLLDGSRSPRPTPPLAAGRRVRLWLMVKERGSLPFPMTTGITEDGVSFALGPAYRGPMGLVCLEGKVGKLGEGWSLQDAQVCR